MKRFITGIIFFCAIFLTSCFEEIEPFMTNATGLPHYDGPTEWLIMVYMAGDNNLSDFAVDNIDEMISAPLSDQKNVRVIVLVDHEGDSDSHLFELREYETYPLEDSALGLTDDYAAGEIDSGSKNTLSAFIDFATTQYESTYQALIIWGHGDGWQSRSSGNNEKRSVAYDELSQTVLNLDDMQQAVSGKDINIIAFDACLMGMLECAYELRNAKTGIEYMVASEEVVIDIGLPYYDILNYLATTTNITPETLGRFIVDSNHDSTKYDYFHEQQSSFPRSMAVIDLTAVETIVPALDSFVDYLSTLNIAELDEKRSTVGSFYNPDYVDLYDLSDLFQHNSADKLKQSVQESVIHSRQRNQDWSNGISINFSMRDHGYYNGTLNQTIDFLVDSKWDDFIQEREFGLTIDITEPDDTEEESVSVSNGDLKCSYLSDTHDLDCYKIEVKNQGTVSITFSNIPLYCEYRVELWSSLNSSYPLLYEDISCLDNTTSEKAVLEYESTNMEETLYIKVYATWGYSLKQVYKLQFSGTANY